MKFDVCYRCSQSREVIHQPTHQFEPIGPEYSPESEEESEEDESEGDVSDDNQEEGEEKETKQELDRSDKQCMD